MRPVRSWALSTPVARTDWAVSLSCRRMIAASPRVQPLQDVLGYGEDGKVVDSQNVLPCGQGLRLGVGYVVAAQTRASDRTLGCIPAMRSWKTRALAIMAQAMRRVCGTLVIPSRRAMSAAMAGRVSLTWSRCFAAPSIPFCRMVAACLRRVGVRRQGVPCRPGPPRSRPASPIPGTGLRCLRTPL